jgi:hypothetical protein
MTIAWEPKNRSIVLYEGRRGKIGAYVIVQSGNGFGPLLPCTEIVNHSPTGFEWGYVGSGPHQLGLALCVDALEGDALRALAVYGIFTQQYVALLSEDGWTITRDEVRAMIRHIEIELQHGMSREAVTA